VRRTPARRKRKARRSKEDRSSIFHFCFLYFLNLLLVEIFKSVHSLIPEVTTQWLAQRENLRKKRLRRNREKVAFYIFFYFNFIAVLDKSRGQVGKEGGLEGG